MKRTFLGDQSTISSGVKGIFAGFVPRSGHRRVGMASARAEQGFGRFRAWLGSSSRDDGSDLVPDIYPRGD